MVYYLQNSKEITMYAFDTLGYAKRLRAGGFTEEQAEVQAEAAKDFIMGELVTRIDLQNEIAGVKRDLEMQTLRLTVRLGLMLATGLAVLATLQKVL